MPALGADGIDVTARGLDSVARFEIAVAVVGLFITVVDVDQSAPEASRSCSQSGTCADSIWSPATNDANDPRLGRRSRLAVSRSHKLAPKAG